MYFYRNQLADESYEYVGPFVMAKEMLYEEVAKSERENKINTFTESEMKVLETSTFEHSIYSINPMELNSKLSVRGHLSHYEYRYIYEANKEAMSIQEWLTFTEINNNKHLNYMSGRSLVKGALVKKLCDLMISHSYLLETTAFKLIRCVVDNRSVESLSRSEYGQYSVEFLRVLRSCKNAGLEYYWSCRSHVDLMQTRIYVETDSLRRNQSADANETAFMSDFDKTSEFNAMNVKRNTASDKKYRNQRATEAKKLAAIVTQLRATRLSKLSDEQRSASEELITNALRTLNTFTEVAPEAGLMNMLERMMGDELKNTLTFEAHSLSGEIIEHSQPSYTTEVEFESLTADSLDKSDKLDLLDDELFSGLPC
ncbi:MULTISPECIES: hypothetical protein [Vibrio]|uniref:Uncharacterized protein n=1 Tax=Vibrio tasmaniensis TaxID=212663 RepID=A0A2N7NCK5_9VIBR|nr:hypothetical protein [Vibrio tasmaniensis]PMO89878.1 hypothetical protein BCT01_00935 [Vibrio tasmaniensis]PMP09950.1 hypothetical protein BCS92_02155 [Vibrio tasmaniensis]TKG27983.1 hypothetical protein FC057_22610 [Vibrio tasmaniensis]TKG41652.1 hypothetical protein FC063_07260 [Vibrio tasmaniensis]TKG42065.1 hypothetical protein FC060_21910 [Vibrio tasmaniensis]